MHGFIQLNNLLLAVVSTIPIAVFSTALLTFLAYWLFIGRHAAKTTPEQESEALRIMQDIRIGLLMRHRQTDIDPQVTTTSNEENETWLL